MILEKTSTMGSIEATTQALGARLARLRLSRNLTQAELAQEAGASVPSIKRLEAGKNTSLDTVLRVLGALKLGDRLLEILPDPSVRPVERVRYKGRERRRARPRRDASKATGKATDWTWGDEVWGDEADE